MTTIAKPKHLKEIEANVLEKLILVKKPSSDLFETQQSYLDAVLKIYQEALKKLIDSSITYSTILNDVRNAYENAIQIRDERISQFITQDELFGISIKKNQRDDRIKSLTKEIEELKEQNLKLTFEISKLKKDMGKLKDDQFSSYLCVMRERDARYTLYLENLALQMKVKELDGSCQVEAGREDPLVLRIALDRCREQLSLVQRELKKMSEEYVDTVPRREFDALETRHDAGEKALHAATEELRSVHHAFSKVIAKKKSIEEELAECKERCSELERAGTPRPHWELCGDFISGGRDRWWQLASGLSSRETLRVLLKELGPAADTDHLEYFDGLGCSEEVPPFLRWSGRVRNLRLSRREVCVLVHDIWRGKEARQHEPMTLYLQQYFQQRYQQPSMRAEWAYNLCAGAEQALDEPQLKMFLGVLHGLLSERVYWGLREQWRALRDNLYRHTKDKETVTMEEMEKVSRATFTHKSEVEVRRLAEAARRHLKVRAGDLHLDTLFHEDEEGFLRSELSLELCRQRAAAQERYLRELVAALGGRRARDKLVTVDALKRAIAIVDPAIDHIRMERYIRWAFSAPSAPLASVPAAPLHAVAARIAAGDIERVGPRHRATQRRAR